MRLWALLDLSLLEVIEFYRSRDTAERTLRKILSDEPGWQAMLIVTEFDLVQPQLTGSGRRE